MYVTLKCRVRDASYKGFKGVLKHRDSLLFFHNQYTSSKRVLRHRYSLVFLSKTLYGIYSPLLLKVVLHCEIERFFAKNRKFTSKIVKTRDPQRSLERKYEVSFPRSSLNLQGV